MYSEVGRGTTVKIYLPRADEPLDSTTPQKPTTSLRGTETILLVEADKAVRQIRPGECPLKGRGLLVPPLEGEQPILEAPPQGLVCALRRTGGATC